MFTGIIEETGVIKSVENLGRDKKFLVSASFSPELKIGDSVAINGVCQTAISKTGNSFAFFSSMETLSLTNLGSLTTGSRVNLERALRADGRLDGHIVAGHVDGVCSIAGIKRGDNSVRYTFKVLDKGLLPEIAKKGSVALDGISLTVFSVEGFCFDVAIIPITLEGTTLKDKKEGDIINLETDVLAKYIGRRLSFNDESVSSITIESLLEKGF
jgi:riboflavin synthase